MVKCYVIFGNGVFNMSRIGKLAINIPSDVNISYINKKITVKGKFGELIRIIPSGLDIEQNDNSLKVNKQITTRTNNALQGLYRTLINNMVIGVSKQFKLTLNLQGVGYRAAIQNQNIILNLGYSHPVKMLIPGDISVEINQNTIINLKGCDKETLGLFAANIRSWRPPEPYKGKGILYQGEIINRKAGKSGKK